VGNASYRLGEIVVDEDEDGEVRVELPPERFVGAKRARLSPRGRLAVDEAQRVRMIDDRVVEVSESETRTRRNFDQSAALSHFMS